VGDPNAAFAAGPRSDRELDGADLRHRAAACGTPRELDLAGRNAYRAPIRGEIEFRVVIPPDVAAGRIGKRELELVGRSLTANVERQRITFGKRQRELLARHHETAAAFEVEVQTHRVPVW